MKPNDFLDLLVAHYWTAEDFRQLQNEVGMDAFENVHWAKEAALRFVSENVKDCEFIFNHRRLTKCK